MKALSPLVLILVFSTSLAQAQSARDRALRELGISNSLHRSLNRTPVQRPRQIARPLTAVARAALPANVIPATCPEPNSVCGYVRVPLDRKHPNGTKIDIYFEQYFHSNPGPAVSAIMVNLGGPGFGSTDGRDYFQFGLFAANMDAHDLLLVDDRGRGQSAAIDCPELQHGGVDFATAEHDCAVQLGAAASRYGTGDVAGDMNDVREALGYEFIDYLGASWGGADAIAFATRYPQHVRSLVLDAPVGPPVVIPYTSQLGFRARSAPSVIGRLCSLSPLCKPDHLRPDEEVVQLVQTIRAHSLTGDAYDADGNLVHVKLDEQALLDYVVRGNFLSKGEIPAAFTSLKSGDPAPLLRIAAEGYFTLSLDDSGDATGFSLGAFYATGCSDVGEPWDWSDPVAKRQAEYKDSVSDLPSDFFFPFSRSVGQSILFSRLGLQCVSWEKPTPSAPIATRGALYPAVPTLVLQGNIDDTIPVEAGSAVASLFPIRQFVVINGSLHETTGYTQCGTDLANRFIETLSAGDTSCATAPEIFYPAVGRFPLNAKDARPAEVDRSGMNRIGLAERKVVSVAVATALDALKRTDFGFTGTGVGLRGGTFETSFLDGGLWISTLTNCAFSQDVIVNGTVNWAGDNSIDADLVVSGPGTAGGHIHVTGAWIVYGPLGKFQVSGVLGGKTVAVLVPES
jgi:pimeloyl-ACP methyl ester carboxylesterase